MHTTTSTTTTATIQNQAQPLQSANDWTVDACCIHNTVYLDIVRGAQDNKTFADAEKFEYFGYK